MRTALATLACVMTMLGAPSVAHADTFDWGKFFTELDASMRGKSETMFSAATHERTSQLYEHSAGNAWFGVAPRVSLVARDWGEAYRLAGDRLSVLDAVRLSSSTRMVVSRVRLSSNTRVTPFAQVGLGQWRTDPNILLATPRATEVATQVGGGIEIQMSNAWQIACETGATVFMREARHDDNIPQTKMWSAMLASRIEF